MARDTGVVLAAAATLVVAAPHPPTTPAAFAHWLATAPPDTALAGIASIAACACLGWLAMAGVLVALTRLPGLAGRSADYVAARVVPGVVRRALEAALGVTVAALPVATTWAGPATADTGRPAPTWSPPSLDRPGAPVAIRRETYVVRSGDCLWTIAASHIGGRPGNTRVAGSWPRWYAANRDVIGPDPDLIRPGQRLAVPDTDREVSR